MNELIKALRRCGTGGSLTERCWTCDYYDREPWCEAALVNDAADAIERLQRELLIVKAENEQFKLLMPGTMR